MSTPLHLTPNVLKDRETMVNDLASGKMTAVSAAEKIFNIKIDPSVAKDAKKLAAFLSPLVQKANHDLGVKEYGGDVAFTFTPGTDPEKMIAALAQKRADFSKAGTDSGAVFRYKTDKKTKTQTLDYVDRSGTATVQTLAASKATELPGKTGNSIVSGNSTAAAPVPLTEAETKNIELRGRQATVIGGLLGNKDAEGGMTPDKEAGSGLVHLPPGYGRFFLLPDPRGGPPALLLEGLEYGKATKSPGQMLGPVPSSIYQANGKLKSTSELIEILQGFVNEASGVGDPLAGTPLSNVDAGLTAANLDQKTNPVVKEWEASLTETNEALAKVGSGYTIFKPNTQKLGQNDFLWPTAEGAGPSAANLMVKNAQGETLGYLGNLPRSLKPKEFATWVQKQLSPMVETELQVAQKAGSTSRPEQPKA